MPGRSHGTDAGATAATVAAEARRIGEAMRAMRKNYALTQQQLAELVGISDRTLRDIEKGTGTPGIGAVLATLKVLGLELEVRG
ncbi:helix-turn-helix domain-containing protein [Corynebacterium doosanense]|uniref:XRE family transcriptional regulator n=1 Tax=Corynebacterium doosanense CAU 212 = DSM 45436 TaxID=558173 RepID=A0A097IEZ1_9CORY|nr:helix-turn-helix domain-containing protein [Corynebacterium doosanense]AIT60689.1 XRE family transcriptional regulator [Corynebacterium doosanense CAU 212 = DSM 45436]